MYKNAFLTLLTILSCNLFSQIIEVRDLPGYYRTIQAGINACPNGGIVKIYPGTYCGSGNVNLNWSNKHISVKSAYYESNVIIDCQNTADYGFILNQKNQTDSLKFLKIKNARLAGILICNGNPSIARCILEYNTHGIQLDNQNNNFLLELSYCTFRYNVNNTVGGSGIYAQGALSIKNCSFLNNLANSAYDGSEILHGTAGSAVYCISDNFILENNIFDYNFGSYDGGTVTLEAIPGINSFCSIIGNTFKHNYFDHVDLGGAAASALSIKNSEILDNISINYNLFFENNSEYLNVINVSANTLADNNFSFYNNTLANEYNSSYAVYLKNQAVTIKNSYFSLPVYSNTNGIIKHSRFYYQANAFPNAFIANNISYGNPMLDSNFKPIWNQNQKSDLIDNGDPDSDEDQLSWLIDTDDRDYDGTRLDIGAVLSEEHGSYFHHLVNNGSTNQFNWVCFPYLDKLYADTNIYDADDLYYNLHIYHANGLFSISPRLLKDICWCYNEDMGNIVYNSNNQWLNTVKTLDSRQGFKIQLFNGINSKIIENCGFLCGQYGNPDETMTIYPPSTLDPFSLVWLGYFKKESEDPLFALSDIVDDLILIKTKNWSISRNSINSEWTYDSKNPRINFGEMVILHYVGNDIKDFVWHINDNGGALQNLAYTETGTSNFTYTEEADYTPVYVKLDEYLGKNRKSLAELGLFINDICYGAEVIEGDTVQINAYISALPDSNASVEFRYWDSDLKSNVIIYDKYCVYDYKTESYQNRYLNFHENKSFYTVSLNAKDLGFAEIPCLSHLGTNYPNPFNPETTIQYSLAEKTHASVKIYNVKGQMIKELINEIQEPGYKQVLWKGDDLNGKKVASGLYFYRLKTNNSSSVRKMLLIK